MRKQIILVYPKIIFEANYPYSWVPYSVLAIASALPKEQYEVIVFDENRNTPDEFAQLLKSVNSPLCIGFSIMTGGGQINNALSLARRAKKICPQTPRVFGGPHVNVLPEETLHHPLVDYVLVGPGQTSFPVLARALCNECSLSEVPGIVWEQDGDILHGPPNLLSNSTMVPYDFNYINVAQYIQKDLTIADRTINYISTQGCVYKCKFCYETNYQRRYGKLPCEVVISDLNLLKERYDVNGIKFYDADWFIDYNRTSVLIESLNRLHVHWAASIHPRDILRAINKKEPLLEKLAQSGCRRLLMGIESGNDRVLKEIVDKGVTTDEIMLVAREIARHGILGSYTFIVGFPGESPKEQEDTFDFIMNLWSLAPQPETRVHIYTPYPGTQLYDEALRCGFVPPATLQGWSNFDYYRAMMPWTDKSLENKVQDFTRMLAKK